jgi:type II secretory pathway pseudopilin PulG
VVLAILGLLAGLVGPQVMKFLGSSKTKTAALQIEDLGATLDLYRLEIGAIRHLEGSTPWSRTPATRRTGTAPT